MLQVHAGTGTARPKAVADKTYTNIIVSKIESTVGGVPTTGNFGSTFMKHFF